jgi:secreted PhoX family phosphatase
MQACQLGRYKYSHVLKITTKISAASSGNTKNQSGHLFRHRNMMKVPKGSFFGWAGFLKAGNCMTNQLNQRTPKKSKITKDNLRFDYL